MTPRELLDLVKDRVPGATISDFAVYVAINWDDRNAAADLVDELAGHVTTNRMHTAIVTTDTTRIRLSLRVPVEYAYTITAWATMWYHDQDPTFLPDAPEDYVRELLTDRFTTITNTLPFGHTLETDERVDILARLLSDQPHAAADTFENAGPLAASITAANINLLATAIALSSSRTVRLPGAHERACLPTTARRTPGA